MPLQRQQTGGAHPAHAEDELSDSDCPSDYEEDGPEELITPEFALQRADELHAEMIKARRSFLKSPGLTKAVPGAAAAPGKKAALKAPSSGVGAAEMADTRADAGAGSANKKGRLTFARADALERIDYVAHRKVMNKIESKMGWSRDDDGVWLCNEADADAYVSSDGEISDSEEEGEEDDEGEGRGGQEDEGEEPELSTEELFLKVYTEKTDLQRENNALKTKMADLEKQAKTAAATAGGEGGGGGGGLVSAVAAAEKKAAASSREAEDAKSRLREAESVHRSDREALSSKVRKAESMVSRALSISISISLRLFVSLSLCLP
jgi:hypothetical protein